MDNIDPTPEETPHAIHDEAFPPKPELPPDEGMMRKLIISLALFVLAYYVFFNKDIRMMGLLVAVLLIHELGHFLAMKYFRYTEVKMFFIPLLGALVTGEKEQVSQRQRAIILLAGPVPGIIIGGALYYAGLQLGNSQMLTAAGIFIFLNAANLLPLTPLDGGKLIETLFFHSRTLLRNIFTFLSAGAVTFLAIKYEMYSLLLIPFFMASTFIQFGTTNKIKAQLNAQGIDYNKPFSQLTNREYWLIRDQVISNIAMFRNELPGVYQVSPRERQILEQVRGLADRQQTLDLGAGGIILFTLIWIIFLGLPVAGIIAAFYARL
jgi:Zn-dependent protease